MVRAGCGGGVGEGAQDEVGGGVDGLGDAHPVGEFEGAELLAGGGGVVGGAVGGGAGGAGEFGGGGGGEVGGVGVGPEAMVRGFSSGEENRADRPAVSTATARNAMTNSLTMS